MKQNTLISALVALGLTACGGGESTSGPTPTTLQKTYTLEVQLAGANDSIELTWLGKSHIVSKTTTLKAEAKNYVSPNSMQYPLGHHCQSKHSKESDTLYRLNINCEIEKNWVLTVLGKNLSQAVSFKWFDQPYTLTDTLELTHSALAYQAPTDFVFPASQNCEQKNTQSTALGYRVEIICEKQANKLLVNQRLPFAVTLTIGGKVQTVQQSTEVVFDEMLQLADINIDQVHGAAQCEVQPTQQSQDYTLICQTFGLSTQGDSLVMLAKDNPATLLVNSEGRQVKNSIQWVDNQLLFLSDKGVETLIMENGKVVGTQVVLAQATAFRLIGDQAYALTESGLVMLENGDWQLVIPLSAPAVPHIGHSGTMLSVTTLDSNGTYHVVKRESGHSAGSNILHSSARKSTGFGLIYGGDINLLTFWDEGGRLGYQPALNIAQPIAAYIDEAKHVSIWRKGAAEHRLTRIHNGEIQIFSALENNQYDWVKEGVTSADHIVGFKDSRITGHFLENGLFSLREFVQNDINELPKLKAITQQSGELFAKFTFTEDENYRTLLPVQDELGWFLIWQKPNSGTLGTLWITNGSVMRKVADSQPQTALREFEIEYGSKELAIVRNNDNKLVIER